MKTKCVLRLWGALAAAVAGGCAGITSTAVPLQPNAGGHPVDLSTYELEVNGQPGGRVLFADGKALREEDGRRTVHVGMRVENQSGGASFRMPTGQLFLASLTPAPLPLRQVDDGTPPELLEVQPGDARSFDLSFELPDRVRIDDVHALKVHWQLIVDGAPQPIERSTTFTANERARLYPNQSARGYDLPSPTNPGGIDRVQNRPGDVPMPNERHITGSLRRAHAEPAAL